MDRVFVSRRPGRGRHVTEQAVCTSLDKEFHVNGFLGRSSGGRFQPFAPHLKMNAVDSVHSPCAAASIKEGSRAATQASISSNTPPSPAN